MPNDYILRSDVEKMLKKQYLYGFGGTNFVHYDELLESISSIQSVDRWIPVTKDCKIPGVFLVTDSKDVGEAINNDGKFGWGYDFMYSFECTHYMALPLLPNPSSHD